MDHHIAQGGASPIINLHQITQLGRIASCLVRINLLDLNTEGTYRDEVKTWFTKADHSAASLTVCCQAIANLNRYLAAHAPADRSAIPHLAEIMPDDVQDPAAWQDKLIAIAQVDALTPDAINQRYRAAHNIEALVDALVEECRDVHQQLTQEFTIMGARQPRFSEPEGEAVESNPYDGPIMRL